MCINDIWPSFSHSFGFLTVCPNVAGAAAAVPARWRRCRSCSLRCSRRWRSSSVSFIFINLTYFRVKLRRSGSDATPAQSPRLFLSHSPPAPPLHSLGLLLLLPDNVPLYFGCQLPVPIPVAILIPVPLLLPLPLCLPLFPSPSHSRCRSQAGS